MSNPAPTLVSTFEVLFTPQLPVAFAPPAVVAVDENVVKGYFLTISNPNPTSYLFTVGFHCNPNPNGGALPANNSLASAVGFFDNGSGGAPQPIAPTTPATDYSTSVRVAANGTVLLGILPAFFNNQGLVTPANIFCRGWVDITLPALRNPKFPELFVAQSTAPVSIILTPEERLTFLPMAAGAAPTTVESQSAFALPLASGAALVSVPPQPGGVIHIVPPLP